LINSGEPECYEEALPVEDKVKWELTMDDAIVSHGEPNMRFG